MLEKHSLEILTGKVIELGFYLNEAVKKEFDKSGISIPYPQMDVNLKK